MILALDNKKRWYSTVQEFQFLKMDHGHKHMKDSITQFLKVMASYYLYLRNGLQPLLAVSKVAAVDVGTDSGCVLLGAFVVATQVFGQLLAIVELDVSHSILSDDSVGPKLLHEEYLIGEIRALCRSQERKRGKSE